MTDAEKKAYYAARKARRAKVAKAKDAKAEAKPEAAKKTIKKCAKKCKACKNCDKHLSPEERLFKAVGVEPPRYCDNEMALGYAIHGFRKALRLQSNKVAEECKKIIDAVANVMKEFDHRVDGVAITYRDVEEKDIVMAKKPVAKKAKK